MEGANEMACRYVRYASPTRASDEWVPPALRDTRCARRASDPKTHNAALRELGIEIDDEDISCTRNIDGRWSECPFYVER
ncbi:MAG: hypothetical protein H6707_20460 [Deltaproteobacteria bacterium]|nr:hypothetical protein [Deltaproteobacteria bacterium]